MGFEKWLHTKLAPFIQNEEEYLLMIVGLAAVALFLYAVIS
ncbi:MAG TPA: hypothetical protein VFX17_01060 [Patescibacteria group bacterium]|nr:hypothetical protein [Patescibacteria group bacterium]